MKTTKRWLRGAPCHACAPNTSCFLLPSSLWKHCRGVSARSFHGTFPPTIKQAIPQASTEWPLMCLQPPGPTAWGWEWRGPCDRPTLGRRQHSSVSTATVNTLVQMSLGISGHLSLRGIPTNVPPGQKWVLMPFSSTFSCCILENRKEQFKYPSSKYSTVSKCHWGFCWPLYWTCNLLINKQKPISFFVV